MKIVHNKLSSHPDIEIPKSIDNNLQKKKKLPLCKDKAAIEEGKRMQRLKFYQKLQKSKQANEKKKPGT